MNNWLNYHHLLYFKTIAEENSVSKAAVKLRLGQPTLSAQLKQFENHLGVELFRREHKKLVLTEQGKIAFEYAKNIFAMGNELSQVLHKNSELSYFQLKVGAIDSVPKASLVKLVSLLQNIKNVSVSITEGKINDLTSDLLSHKLDLILTNFIPSNIESKSIVARQVVKQNIAIYGAPKFKNLIKQFPKSLENSNFILSTYDSKLRYDFDQWIKNKKINVNIIAETQDLSLKKHLAVEGLGLIPTAKHNVLSYLASKELIEIGELPNLFEELYIVKSLRKYEHHSIDYIFERFNI